MTIWMIVMICVGCAVGLAGLAFLALSVLPLVKAASAAGQAASAHVQKLVRQGQALGPQVAELQGKLVPMLEGIERLTASANRLNYLKQQLQQPFQSVTGLKK
jgi:hypothetical protein